MPTTVASFRGIEKLSSSDLKATVQAANWIGINPDYLLAVIKFETGDKPFDHTSQNRFSKATGVIQFLPDTAARIMLKRWPPRSEDPKPTNEQKELAINKLLNMSYKQQLEWVKVYFGSNRKDLKTVEDVYLAVFYPKGIGLNPSDVIAVQGSKVYDQNFGFDRNQKGYITREDVTSTIASVLRQSLNQPRIIVPTISILGLGLTVGGAYGIYRFLREK